MLLDDVLRREREKREGAALQRTIRWLEHPRGAEVIWDGRAFVNFASNDYLGLAQHPQVKAAAIEATEKYGAGAGAARLVSGTLRVHRELEIQLAKFKRAPAALAFGSGYAAAVGTICALVCSNDLVIIDKLVHASLVDGARLSGAKLRVFDHNDTADLEKILSWATGLREANPETRILIVTESVFSMDGDCAPLGEIADIKDLFGAWLMVDEAHALGVLGAGRRGLAEQLGVANRIEVQMGTLGKAVGSAGGFIAGSETLIDHVVNSARSFIFSTSPPPGAVAAATAGIEIIASEEGDALRNRLLKNVSALRTALPESFAALVPAESGATAIVPIILEDEQRALRAAEALKQAGFLVPAIRYPTVARGKARLRITVSALHTEEQIARLASALGKL
jgi:glycine C-acetyltransferase/8-amino-7-oxononanoate synthase